MFHALNEDQRHLYREASTLLYTTLETRARLQVLEVVIEAVMTQAESVSGAKYTASVIRRSARYTTPVFVRQLEERRVLFIVTRSKLPYWP